MFDKKKYDKEYIKQNYKRVALDLTKEQNELFDIVLNNKKEKKQTIIKKLIKKYIKKGCIIFVGVFKYTPTLFLAKKFAIKSNLL